MISINAFFQIVDATFLWYFASINLVYVLLLILSTPKILGRRRELLLEDLNDILRSNSLPEISFIIPAYNQAATLEKTINNLKELTYRYKKIIVVNDGSQDESLAILQKELVLIPISKYYEDTLKTDTIRQVYCSKKYPEFLVIDKENGGGKFDALNAGINAVESPYFISVDADTFIDDSTFLSLVKPLLMDPELIAVGASVKISNGCAISHREISTKTFPQATLPTFQTLEYMRSFLERQGWDYIGGNFVMAGAFGIFQTKIVIEAGGYVNTVAEDMEIIIRLHRLMKEQKTPYKIRYLPDSVAWTEAPTTFHDLAKQRAKWHRGLLDCLWYHKKTLFNPKYGLFAYFVYPFWIWGEAIEPVVEALGILYIILGYLLGKIHAPFIIFFLAVTWGFTLIFTALCILIEELSFNRYPSLRSLTYLFFYNAFENFGYRQANIFFRLKGFYLFFKDFSKVHRVTKYVETLMNTKKTKSTIP